MRWLGCTDPAHEDDPNHEGLTCEEYDFEFLGGPAPLTEEERAAEVAQLEQMWGAEES